MDKNDNKAKDKKEEKKVDAEVEELKKRVGELDNEYKRALADYQNLEKRTREERTKLILTANKNLLLRLLPVLDTLISAAKHAQDEGLKLSIKQFEAILRAEGVERVEILGKEFDPKFMQCVDVKEGEEGKVIEEVRTGYKLGEEVLREALVVVGKKGDSETSSE